MRKSNYNLLTLFTLFGISQVSELKRKFCLENFEFFLAIDPTSVFFKILNYHDFFFLKVKNIKSYY